MSIIEVGKNVGVGGRRVTSLGHDMAVKLMTKRKGWQSGTEEYHSHTAQQTSHRDLGK